MNLAEKIVALDDALERAGIPHAFGGALALAWCTGRARGTIDIDLNVFVDVGAAEATIGALPTGVRSEPSDLVTIERDGQVRLWWDSTPIDLFFNTTEFHEQASARVRRQEFAGASIPFLACSDLAVFKAFFNRTRDWADLEAMLDAGTMDVDRVLGVIVLYLGPADERVERLRRLAG